jgi:hypothetical protein
MMAVCGLPELSFHDAKRSKVRATRISALNKKSWVSQIDQLQFEIDILT